MALDITQFDGTFDLEFLRDGETVELLRRKPLTVRVRDGQGKLIADVREGEYLVRLLNGKVEIAAKKSGLVTTKLL